MIAKISATENLGGALGYNFKKVNKKEATLLLAHGLYQNRAGEYTMSEVLADMQALIPEKRLLHVLSERSIVYLADY